MQAIAAFIKRYVMVRIFLAIVLSVLMGVLIGAGLQTPASSDSNQFDRPGANTNNTVVATPAPQGPSKATDPLNQAVTNISKANRDQANPQVANQINNVSGNITNNQTGKTDPAKTSDQAKNPQVPVEVVKNGGN